MKSVKPMDGPGEPPAQRGGRNAEGDFHGQKRSNDTHASTTDLDARLYRNSKGKETKLCFIGHALMENRHGWAMIGTAGRLVGHFYIHNGDDSAFVCERGWLLQQPARAVNRRDLLQRGLCHACL